MVFVLHCSAVAPSLQLLSSENTRAWLGTRSAPGHVCMMPGGKAGASSGTVTMHLLSHLSHEASSIHNEDWQEGAGFTAALLGRDPEQAEGLCLPWQRLGSSSLAAQLQSDGEGRAPASLSTCHYIPGRLQHFAVIESLVAGKLAWPPCQGYRQPNIPYLPLPDSLSLRVCSLSSKASVWLSFADVGLLTIPLSSLPAFVVLRISSNLSRSFLAIKNTLTQCRTPGCIGKKTPSTWVFCLQSPERHQSLVCSRTVLLCAA